MKFAKNAKAILLLILNSYNPYPFLIEHGQQSIDFIEGLPNLRGNDTILVAIDILTKYEHFVAMLHPFTALTMAQEYMNQVYRLNGAPKSIVSN